MKKLILLEFLLLFLATTFHSNPPPGWYQQQLPVNDFVNDIFFIDSLNGWVATNFSGSGDTAYVMRTTNGGNNWIIQERSGHYYSRLQFLDVNNGFLCGGVGGAFIWKTTNGGDNWFELFNFGLGFGIDDIQFLNKDTGWACSNDLFAGAIWKTTDAGKNWIRQLHSPFPNSTQIKAIHILNKDTGWAISSETSYRLYRTINGGVNWNVQYIFGGFLQDVSFLNNHYGVVSKSRMSRTTDGGFTWIESLNEVGGVKIRLVSDSIGWAGSDFNLISKTTNGGRDWSMQSSPIFSNINISIVDTIKGWAGGTGIVKTTNGGISTFISNNLSEVPEVFNLYQNYPNPFNPKTIISYDLKKSSYVELKVYNIQGKEIKTLVNKNQNPGIYQIEFNLNQITESSSGIYFYRIEIRDEINKNVYSKSKTMVLLK